MRPTVYIFAILLFVLVSGTESIGPINCNRPHEEYQCGSACQNECATLGQECPIVNIRCNNACYCKKGYARNSCGDCIPERNC